MDSNKKMYQVACDDTVACGYYIKGYDKNDLVEGLKFHAKQKHNLDATNEEILKKTTEL